MQPKLVPGTDGRVINVMGDQVRVILGGDDNAGAFALIEQTGEPGSGIPLHVHTRDDEVFQVIEGELEFQIADKTHAAGPGTVVYAPRGIPHSFRVLGNKTARFQVTVVPGGLEKMLTEISELKGPPDPKAIGAVCGKYGIQFLGAPESA